METKKFIDIAEHLQDILNEVAPDVFLVRNIRDLKGVDKRTIVVVNELLGSVYQNSASLPVKIDIFTQGDNENTIKDIQTIFTALAKAKNGKSFISEVKEGDEVKSYTVYEFYNTPAVANPVVEFGTGKYCEMVCYANYNVLFDVGNVKEIKIDGENIEFTNGSISYSIEAFSNRQTGKELNVAYKRSSALNIQFTMVNKTSVFTNKVFRIMTGEISGNNKFECYVKLTNGIEFTVSTILSQNQFNFAQSSPTLPSLQIVLVKTKGNN